MKVYIIISLGKRYVLYNAEGVRVSQASSREAINKFLVDLAFSSGLESFKISYTDDPDVCIVTVH